LPEVLTGLRLDLLAVLFGLCVGSFLNVLALRSLAEESLLWPASHCPRCKHPLAFLDNIPVLSWLFLQGKCRYCKGPISWQYPLVEAATALTFVAIERVYTDLPNSPFNIPYWNDILGTFLPRYDMHYIASAAIPGMPWLGVGALFLACTLIAVTVTDFREKLIPHDITYPAMLVGIAFSAIVRQDLLGAMAGIGASYILFDFIAFYGLKVYLMSHGGSETGRRRRLKRRLPPRRRRRLLSRALRWRVDLASIEKDDEEEPMEVMGGGDAVLSAVMAAFLGWQLLTLSLICGFIIGTIMGMFLLVNEMKKANLLHTCGRHSVIGALIGATVLGCLGFIASKLILQSPDAPMAIPMAILGAIGGALLGVVSVGTRVSKPYPFGPALAAGGMIAIFLLPNWVYLSAIALNQH
jgi:prepilin signal peptidase PulO-like enzyme (type II secretory pathway)